ncbi:porin PorA family protein [Streptomyces sp. WMMC500]|uniref:porin PorA family protein n=1 Tax=Streptomyces sp. WMMC500 TaxID=3015154 RepID=UPI00248BC94A|nr:porin PorA family protein [Streptomyces sp. WMMC500]WBB61916.1 porin PorA family protein [Streptomyces sp. WMMC500]
MRRKKSTIALGAGAVILVAAAAVLRFAVVPVIAQVPSDLDATARYAGTASLLDTTALENGDSENLFIQDLPITASQRVQVVDTDGGTAVASEDLAMRDPEGKKIRDTHHVYAVDRRDLDAKQPPDGSDAETHDGLSVGFPLTPEKTDYPFWDATTQDTAPAKYRETTSTEGRETYVYEFHQSGAVADPATLEALPEALPKTAVQGLAAGLPAAGREEVTAALPGLADPVSLTYTAEADTTFTVDTATGVPLHTVKSQKVTANIDGPEGTTPLFDILSYDLESTPESVDERVQDASDAARLLSLAENVIPLALVLAGALLATAAVWTARRGGSEPAAPGASRRGRDVPEEQSEPV